MIYEYLERLCDKEDWQYVAHILRVDHESWLYFQLHNAHVLERIRECGRLRDNGDGLTIREICKRLSIGRNTARMMAYRATCIHHGIHNGRQRVNTELAWYCELPGNIAVYLLRLGCRSKDECRMLCSDALPRWRKMVVVNGVKIPLSALSQIREWLDRS